MSSAPDTGATATVVGAGAGIGRALAVEFAARGFAVAALSRNADRLRSLGEQVQGQGGRIDTVACDVTDAAALTEALAGLAARTPPVQVVVHMAGSALPIGPIWQCDAQQALAAIDTMLSSAWVTTQVCLRQMVDAGTPGLVLLASSGAGSKLAVGRAVYSACKIAVDQLVRIVGAELELAGAAAAIAALYPGRVDTGMQAEARAAAARLAGGPFGAPLEPFTQLAAAGQLVAPDVVGRHIAELAEREPATLNGRIWRLRDGDWSVAPGQ